MILYKNVPEKKSFYGRKGKGTKDVCNQGAINNSTPKYRCVKKSFLWKRLILDLIFTRFMTFLGFFFSSDIFSSGLFFLLSYFLRLYWQPTYYFREKVPGIQNTGLYLQWHFSKDLRKFGLFSKVFISRFSSRNFFPRT